MRIWCCNITKTTKPMSNPKGFSVEKDYIKKHGVIKIKKTMNYDLLHE